MIRPRPFRFGVLALGVPSCEAVPALARRVEALGYATLQVDDHLDRPFAPIAALTAAAMVTTTLRVGSAVLANDFRHPVMLAREAAALDALSGGRLELGLGTGYGLADYEQAGMSFDPPSVRVSRLAEAVRVIKGAFGEEPFSFAGRYYTVRDLAVFPKPAQHPHPPLLIGGGSQRVLSLAAREADIVGINLRTTPEGGLDFASIAPEATAQKIAWVRAAAGKRFDRLELHALVPFVAVTAAPRPAAEQLHQAAHLSGQMTVDDLLVTPHALIGTIDQISETLLARREQYGISYITIFANQVDAFAPVVQRLAGQ